MIYGAIGVAVAVGFVYLLGRFVITDDDDQPSGFNNPWLELDIERLEFIKVEKHNKKFRISGKSKSFPKGFKYVVQLTQQVEGRILFMSIKGADSPPTSKFLYRHTNDDGLFEFEINAPDNIDQVILRHSKHIVWERG